VRPPLPGILAEIVASKERELEDLRSRRSELEEAAAGAPPARSLSAALRRSGEVALMAECKRRSPGAGEIRPGLDPAELVRGYRDEGAAALSVLTDRPFFGGGPEDVRAARESVELPILRKDFTLDTLQAVEARAMGADAVLLIVRILGDDRLRELLDVAAGLGMDALVETHDADEVRRALDAGAGIVGINNRDLATFETELSTTLGLLDEVGDDVVVVSESGIRTREDVARLGAAGVDAVLVGETLLRAEDPGAAAAHLAGVPRRARARTGR
jgi:indole-3-glycerol phosphate synthase